MGKKNILTLLGLIAIIFAGQLFLSALPALAAPCDGTEGVFKESCENLYLARPASDSTLQRMVLAERLGFYINAVLGTLGVVGILYFTFGAYKYLSSAGASDKIEGAKKQMIYTIIGIVILLLVYSLSTFVLRAVLGSTSGTNCTPGTPGCEGPLPAPAP